MRPLETTALSLMTSSLYQVSFYLPAIFLLAIIMDAKQSMCHAANLLRELIRRSAELFCDEFIDDADMSTRGQPATIRCSCA